MEWLVFTIFEQFMLNLGNGWLYQMISSRDYAEMQLTVGPVGPRARGQNFRGSGKWRLCVRPNDRQTFLLLGAVKNQISVGLGYLLDP